MQRLVQTLATASLILVAGCSGQSAGTPEEVSTGAAQDAVVAEGEVTLEDLPVAELMAELDISRTPELGDIAAPLTAESAAASTTPANPKLAKPLTVWVKGSLQTRSDFAYRSVDIRTSAWVTEGPNATDPRVEVDNLETSFSEVCDGTKSRAWPNEDYNGFRFFRRQKGFPAPGRNFCIPSRVCWVGCATENGVRWCAKTKACPSG
jgi:hypothetical protein